MTVALIPTRSYLSPLMPRSGDVLQWWRTQSDTDFVPPWSSLPFVCRSNRPYIAVTTIPNRTTRVGPSENWKGLVKRAKARGGAFCFLPICFLCFQKIDVTKHGGRFGSRTSQKPYESFVCCNNQWDPW